MTNIGIVGTGFIAQGIARLIQNSPGLTLQGFLSRRPLDKLLDFPVCREKDLLIEKSDLIIECSGDPIYGTEVIDKVMDAGLPVLTMNCELQVVTGSYFADKGYISECDGDQPGCLARLKEEVEIMGFNPMAYVNVKGFLNHNPSLQDMEYWSQKQGVRVPQTTSFTDGTKLQIEQVLVANGLGCEIAEEGLIGGSVADLKETGYLGDAAKRLGLPISDYIISPQSPPGVFIIADHVLAETYKGFGPIHSMTTENGDYQILVKPYHLCHFEVIRSINDVLSGKKPLINNSTRPRFGVAAIAKRPIAKGSKISKAIGSFDLRGIAVSYASRPDHVPIGLISDAVTKEDIEEGQILSFSDVDLPNSLALEIYQKIPLPL